MAKHVATASSASRLMSLSAVVLDTETTGPDALKAEIIQVGAIKIRHGEIKNDEQFNQLVKPTIPIEPQSTRIHGLVDNDLLDAPRFQEIIPSLNDFIGPSVIIGHHIAFDLTLLRRSYEAAGADFTMPRALDTRALTRLVAPMLPDYALDTIAGWLGIAYSDRHTALGDAQLTAELFQRLVPMLYEENIFTLAEAETASRRFGGDEDEQIAAGWKVIDQPGEAETEKLLSGFDSFPYRHRIKELMIDNPIVVDENTPLSRVINEMAEVEHSFAFVKSSENDQIIGILTDKDIFRILSKIQLQVLSVEVGDVMKSPVQTVRAEGFLYRALGRISRLNINQLGVTDDDGEIIGAITARRLIGQRALEIISLGDGIDQAQNEAELGGIWAELPMVAKSMLADDISPRNVTAVISRELLALTRRCAELAVEKMVDKGAGEPPCEFAVLVLGSAGRGESMLAMDQDNAIIYSDDCEAHDQWFKEMAEFMNDMLHAVGVPNCKGGVMARNKAWRHTESGWQQRVEEWIKHSEPEDILNSDIFFDCTPCHGSMTMGSKVWRDSMSMGSASKGYQKLVAVTFAHLQAPLKMFGGFKQDNGRVDLKSGGLLPIVASGRLAALKHHVLAHGTKERFEAIIDDTDTSESDILDVIKAHDMLLGFVLNQQLDDIFAGIAPSNKVVVKNLSKDRKQKLQWALEQVEKAKNIAVDMDPMAFG